MCFFAGGIRKAEQGFLASTRAFFPSSLNFSDPELMRMPWFLIGAANVNSSLLTISVIAVLLPAAFVIAIGNNANTDIQVSQQTEGNDVLRMSRGVSSFFVN